MIPLSDAHFILKWVKLGLIQKNKALQNTWKAHKINTFIYPTTSSSGFHINLIYIDAFSFNKALFSISTLS